MLTGDADLTPRQRDVLSGLIDLGGSRPTLPADLGARLAGRLERGIEPLLDVRSGSAGSWRITKRQLTEVHQCEGLHAARREVPFEWSPELARGTLAHRAIERVVLATTSAPPLEQARATLERACNDDNDLAAFLRGIDDDVRADLVRDVSNAVTEFLSQWPPIPPSWTPRVETAVRVELCDHRIVLSGVYDLALGKPHGSESRVLIVDFKAGDIHADHLWELRFYALIETLRVGVAPYRIAAYSLPGAGYRVERVCEPLLEDTVDWVLAGVQALGEIDAGREPRLTPSPLCAFCPEAGRCVPGRDFLATRARPVRTAER